MINNGADEVTKETFKSLQSRCQNNLEELMKGSQFVFNYVYSLYYRCHKINLNCDGSYVGLDKKQKSPDWIRNEKSIIDTINKNDNKFF